MDLSRKSQYRSDYEGIDTKLHRREPPVAPKDKQQTYVVPYQKMDTMTVTQVDQRGRGNSYHCCDRFCRGIFNRWMWRIYRVFDWYQ